jgi:hypothetical protein
MRLRKIVLASIALASLAALSYTAASAFVVRDDVKKKGTPLANKEDYVSFRRFKIIPAEKPTPGHIVFDVATNIWRGSKMGKQPRSQEDYFLRAEVYDATTPDKPLLVSTKGPFPAKFTPGHALTVKPKTTFNLGPFPSRPKPYTVKVYLMDGNATHHAPIDGIGDQKRNYSYRAAWKIAIP